MDDLPLLGAADINAWLIKTDASGIREWDRVFGEQNWDQAATVLETFDGGYVIAGMTRSYGLWEQAWLIKTDDDGKQEWSKTFGGEAGDWSLSVQQTADGGYILAGKTSSFRRRRHGRLPDILQALN